ncbi:MAG: ABC transporter permease [Acidimicrobiia bacterium]|nr:ABC transporter permease [Acidimicrobiia bacterium]
MFRLARLDLLDGLRSRRQLVIRALTPVGLLLVLGAVLALVGGGDERIREGDYTVAVEGDRNGAAEVLGSLERERLRFVPVDDATRAVFDGTDVGVVLPDDLDARLAQGERLEITVVENPVRRSSRAAGLLVTSAVLDLHAAEVRSVPVASGERRAEPAFTYEITTIELTFEGVSVLVAQLIPALLCLQAALLTNGAASRMAGRTQMGLVQSQLALPVRRSELAGAKATAELGVGLVVSLPVLGIVLLLSALRSLDDFTGAEMAVAALAVLVALVAMGVLAAATGVVIGLVARTHGEVSLGTGVVLVVAAVTAGLVALGPFDLPSVAAVVPVVGLVSSLRHLLDGQGSIGWVAVAIGVTLLAAFFMVRVAGRSLDAERMVTRS